MAGVAEYDGYLEFDNDQVRESFVQLNENVRALQERVKSSEDHVSRLQDDVKKLEVTKSDSLQSGWSRLKTWEANGTDTGITFEDSDGGFNSTYSQYMIIGEGLKPSTDSAYLACIMSVGGDYKQWHSASPVYYYSYFGYNESATSFDTWGSNNQPFISLTDNSYTLGGDAARAETVDFTAYLTAPRTTGRPTKLRWVGAAETDSSMDFHGAMQNVVGSAKFSTSITAPSYGFNPIDGIKFMFLEPTSNNVMTIPWGKVSFFGLEGH